MSLAIIDSELGFRYRLFCKTVSNSASWGFDRFRLYTPKWHTKVQVRRQDGSVVATKDFSAGSFEHEFNFDLSGNTAKQEYSVYIAGVPEGAKFDQAYAWPSGYSATYGRNAEITYWNFNEVNIEHNGTSTGRIRFHNNPIYAIEGALNLKAAEVRFENCSLNGDTLADMLIGLDNSGILNGIFSYSNNNAAPETRAQSAYDSLLNTKNWTLTGLAPAVSNPNLWAETAANAHETRVLADFGRVEDKAALLTYLTA